MPNDIERERARLTEALTRNRAGLTRFARARISDQSDMDAEDVVSEVTLRLFERADVLVQVENLTAYLFRAVGNALVDLFRRRRDDAPLEDEHEAPSASPDTSLEQARRIERVDAALTRLSPAERAVWLAVEVEGWTYRELAERWNEPLGTLLSRKNRAGKTLRALLSAEEDA